MSEFNLFLLISCEIRKLHIKDYVACIFADLRNYSRLKKIYLIFPSANGLTSFSISPRIYRKNLRYLYVWMQDKCKENDTTRENKYISFALRNKRINHKSIIHRSENSNQSRRVTDDEYVTRNCSYRYSVESVSLRAEIYLFLKIYNAYICLRIKQVGVLNCKISLKLNYLLRLIINFFIA